MPDTVAFLKSCIHVRFPESQQDNQPKVHKVNSLVFVFLCTWVCVCERKPRGRWKKKILPKFPCKDIRKLSVNVQDGGYWVSAVSILTAALVSSPVVAMSSVSCNGGWHEGVFHMVSVCQSMCLSVIVVFWMFVLLEHIIFMPCSLTALCFPGVHIHVHQLAPTYK